nr:immunoglobulin light chain junction region [Macaca mulatta]MOV34170.1 immunoglobulin light chain junction region [Macaca mulatta]MOV34260.1 immunoglobulin light chain junction region [Macaca mulatta]MOV34273.1 immunoglobulin light chain junction region [Macaca mulatta]MOV34596.1 immunoglobulin light chain junction region [Macaca mulatta]
CMQGIEYPLTF